MEKVMNVQISAAWEFVRRELFSERTNLVYDHPTRDPEYFPTLEQIAANFPNSCGYGTGMEDSMISGGSALAACLDRYAVEKSADAAEFAHLLVDGICRCGEASSDPGFLPRSLSIRDGKSHYIDSSRDQYTLAVYALSRFLRSGLARDDERERITRLLVNIARRAEKNVVEDNEFDLLREDGGKSLVTTMWGEKLVNHERLRLPMLYLAAYDASGDGHWRELYRGLRGEAIEKSLPMVDYWHLYTLQQMQMSVKLCFELETDDLYREKLQKVLNEVADYVEQNVPKTREDLRSRADYNEPLLSLHEATIVERRGAAPDGGLPNKDAVRGATSAYLNLQDAFDSLTVVCLAGREPSAALLDLFGEALGILDFERHESAAPAQAIEAWWGYVYSKKVRQ